MVRNINGYTPNQGDIIIINFNPSVGTEIQKKRPAIVTSSNQYNAVTGMVAVCPITSTKKDHFIPLDNSHKTKGYVNPLQVKTLDYTDQRRAVRFIERATSTELGEVLQIVKMIFDFDNLLAE
ncbi:MAG: type II toxin-antitoxin system PemK/MazF family toxin [Enterococcus sp.]